MKWQGTEWLHSQVYGSGATGKYAKYAKHRCFSHSKGLYNKQYNNRLTDEEPVHDQESSL